ncbi:hypothetical protein EYF80_021653 [Liparis tanakae]|uniref:Uncharacterized protein n=1 Tax=Liparis tanakae TaxID=230148 RepID=A0A4Z2HRB8_9TELE|nr:hypothetical protein EYF80_021653 [Liparis tanakae]
MCRRVTVELLPRRRALKLLGTKLPPPLPGGHCAEECPRGALRHRSSASPNGACCAKRDVASGARCHADPGCCAWTDDASKEPEAGSEPCGALSLLRASSTLASVSSQSLSSDSSTSRPSSPPSTISPKICSKESITDSPATALEPRVWLGTLSTAWLSRKARSTADGGGELDAGFRRPAVNRAVLPEEGSQEGGGVQRLLWRGGLLRGTRRDATGKTGDGFQSHVVQDAFARGQRPALVSSRKNVKPLSPVFITAEWGMAVGLTGSTERRKYYFRRLATGAHLVSMPMGAKSILCFDWKMRVLVRIAMTEGGCRGVAMANRAS